MTARTTKAKSFLRLPRVVSSSLMGKLKPSRFVILMAIIEKTIGWNKDFDSISNHQLQKLTGLSRRTIIYAVKDLAKIGLIIRQEKYGKCGRRDANSYSLRMDEIMAKGAIEGDLFERHPRAKSRNTIDRELEKKVNDSARERTPFEAENTASPSVTRPMQAEEDEQPKLELAHPSVPSASPEELEMMRLLDEQFSKLEQELTPLESQVPEPEPVTICNLLNQTPVKQPLPAPKRSYSQASRRPKPAVRYVQPQKTAVRIVSSKVQIASVFRGPESKITSFAKPKPCVKRYMPKLSHIQAVTLEWLRSREIDTSDETLQYWASKYGLSRLQDVYREAVRRKARSIGAYMHALLKKGAVVMTDFIAQNAAFASEFKKNHGWRNIEIDDKYAIIHLGCCEHEVSFNMHPDDFEKYLKAKYSSFRSY